MCLASTRCQKLLGILTSWGTETPFHIHPAQTSDLTSLLWATCTDGEGSSAAPASLTAEPPEPPATPRRPLSPCQAHFSHSFPFTQPHRPTFRSLHWNPALSFLVRRSGAGLRLGEGLPAVQEGHRPSYESYVRNSDGSPAFLCLAVIASWAAGKHLWGVELGSQAEESSRISSPGSAGDASPRTSVWAASVSAQLRHTRHV